MTGLDYPKFDLNYFLTKYPRQETSGAVSHENWIFNLWIETGDSQCLRDCQQSRANSEGKLQLEWGALITIQPAILIIEQDCAFSVSKPMSTSYRCSYNTFVVVSMHAAWRQSHQILLSKQAIYHYHCRLAIWPCLLTAAQTRKIRKFHYLSVCFTYLNRWVDQGRLKVFWPLSIISRPHNWMNNDTWKSSRCCQLHLFLIPKTWDLYWSLNEIGIMDTNNINRVFTTHNHTYVILYMKRNLWSKTSK